MARERKNPSKIDRLLDELMEDGVDAEDLFGGRRPAQAHEEAHGRTDPGSFKLTDHLGYEKHAPDGRNRGNSRNGKTTKTLKDDKGDLPVEIPRDREGSFDPKLIRKYQTRWPDFDDKIISMYARGMSTLRYPGPYRRPLRGGHLARTGLADHRHRNRRGPGLAVAAPG